jgi:hypothetical protein
VLSPVEFPVWLAPVERLVLAAARDVQMLTVLTPLDARKERERLVADLRAGRRATPRWTYVRKEHDGLRRALDAAERALAREPAAGVAALYLARVRELAVEAALCAAAGTGELARLAAQRFAPSEGAVAGAASALSTLWLEETAPGCRGPVQDSDAATPDSLLSLMRAAVGKAGLPFQVVAAPSLPSLAATGEHAIYVATGRRVAQEDAARTVLHEIEGHARPRARALRARSLLFRVGTARGADDQEGRALLLEERAGWLGPSRRRQLAARHRAVEAMQDGASFADVAFRLARVHGFDETEAVVAAERAFRGGDGSRPGLGRERVYLESLVRVRAHLVRYPDDEHVLSCGQVAVDCVGELRRFAA